MSCFYLLYQTTKFTAFISSNVTISRVCMDRVEFLSAGACVFVCRRNTKEAKSKKVTMTLPQVLVHPRVGSGSEG